MLVALCVTLVGGLLTRDIRFVLTCAIASAMDIWLFGRIGECASAGSAQPGGRGPDGRGVLLSVGRVVLKAVLLVIATSVPGILSFWGMVAGVLIMDTTIVVIGGMVSWSRTFRSPRAE